MITTVTCSHCHYPNRLDAGRPTACVACGHRADRPRLDCDCPRCRPPADADRRARIDLLRERAALRLPLFDAGGES